MDRRVATGRCRGTALNARVTDRNPHRLAPVTFSEERGVRYLHFGTEWVQGAMRISKPDVIILEYVQQMMAWTLFLDAPRTITQLGLGVGALTKFCYRHYPGAVVTAVELNRAVMVAARVMFAMPPPDAHLSVVVDDAAAFVRASAQRGAIDVLQADLYDAAARGPVHGSEGFYADCRACLRAPGVMTVNLFGSHASFGRNMKALAAAFDGRVIALPEVHEGNRIALAFNGPPLEASWKALDRRAARLRKSLGLPAKSWLEGLKSVASRRTGADDTHFRI